MTGIWLEPGAHLGWERGVLRIEREGRLVTRVPARMAGQVIIRGAVTLDSRALLSLAEAGVPTTLMPARSQGPVAQVTRAVEHGIALRDLQHRIRLSPALASRMARRMLEAKWAACDCAARHLGIRWQAPGLPEDLPADHLLGHEGSAARHWYSLWAATLGPAWSFEGRRRRPPPDPVNALLSLTYTLAGSLIPPLLVAQGLDPAFGYLHQPRPGRTALALDLLEPLRPWCDLFVQTLTHGDLHPEKHFIQVTGHGVRLNREGQDIFYAAWGAWRFDAAAKLKPGSPPPVLWPDTPVPEDAISLNDWARHLTGCAARYLRHLGASLNLPPEMQIPVDGEDGDDPIADE